MCLGISIVYCIGVIHIQCFKSLNCLQKACWLHAINLKFNYRFTDWWQTKSFFWLTYRCLWPLKRISLFLEIVCCVLVFFDTSGMIHSSSCVEERNIKFIQWLSLLQGLKGCSRQQHLPYKHFPNLKFLGLVRDLLKINALHFTKRAVKEIALWNHLTRPVFKSSNSNSQWLLFWTIYCQIC